MKFAFSTNAYRNFSIEESIDMISSVGFSAVEIMCDIPHAYPPISEQKILSIKKTLKKNNMEISNLNGFMLCAIQDFHHPSWIEEDANFRQQRINHTVNCIELAKKLGAKTVSTEPGGPPTNSSKNHQLELFAEGIDNVIPVAEENDVKLLIEPEPGLLIENSSEFVNFISRFESKHLGLNFDIGHFFCVNEEPAELIKSLKDYINHIHLEDISADRVHKHLIPGEGSIDFHPIFEALDEIDYDGYVTIELYPYQNDPQSAAKTTLEFLKSNYLK